MLNAIYNIVDQIYIGNSWVGLQGVAATNISFPLVTICTATALLFGTGGGANFNLMMGKGEKEEAANSAGNSIFFLIVVSCLIAASSLVFLKPMLTVFGATETTMQLSAEYTSVICVGVPFAVFTSGACILIRSDGSPLYSMVCMVSGAIFNIIFDPIFLYVFDMGIFGIALATILGQMLTAIIAAYYMIKNFKTVKLERKHFKPSKIHFIKICSLGMAAFFNQIAMFTVQVTLNNILKHYGAMSPYGSDIPLACVGSLSKINFLYMSFVLGIAQGCQPIYGFNYGGKNYRRVKECYRLATSIGSIISVCALVIFQLFPRQLASIFGSGSELYFEFATKYIRIFMAATFINGLQPITSNFFTALGKASTGIFISLTRQVIFLLPLVIILPIFLGIDGVLFAGPIADIISGIVALSLVHREFSSPDFKGAPVAP